ncbi:MAG TPA: asparagine synthase-related protein, partial [Steroidobacteraceae bacterium]
PQGMRKWFVDPLVNLIDPNNPVTPLRKLRSYVDQARIPMPERLETWNFMYREDVRTMLEPEFLAAVDIRAPLRTMADVYSASPGHSLLQHMLFYDWHFTLSDNDLRKVGTTCELAGVRVSYPMLDPAVIDLSLRVPAEQMMQGYELRSFYKRAMRGFLPPEILAKKKHGFGLPFGIWLKEHPRLGELIYGLLSDLKQRGIVRADFLDRLIADHREGHPGYYGYAIWDLSMLEAWLQAHPGFTLS